MPHTPSHHIYTIGFVADETLARYVTVGAPGVHIREVEGGVAATREPDGSGWDLTLVAHAGLCDPTVVPAGHTPVALRGYNASPAMGAHGWFVTGAWDPATTVGLDGVVPYPRAVGDSSRVGAADRWLALEWRPPAIVAVLGGEDADRYAAQTAGGLIPPSALRVGRPWLVARDEAVRASDRLGVSLTRGHVHVLDGGRRARVLATRAIGDLRNDNRLRLAYAGALERVPRAEELLNGLMSRTTDRAA